MELSLLLTEVRKGKMRERERDRSCCGATLPGGFFYSMPWVHACFAFNCFEIITSHHLLEDVWIDTSIIDLCGGGGGHCGITLQSWLLEISRDQHNSLLPVHLRTMSPLGEKWRHVVGVYNMCADITKLLLILPYHCWCNGVGWSSGGLNVVHSSISRCCV